MKSGEPVKKLPKSLFSGAIPIRRSPATQITRNANSDPIDEWFGVRRINETSLEVSSGAHVVKNAYGSAIGVLLLFGIFFDLVFVLIFPPPYPASIYLSLILVPILLAGLGGLMYLFSKNIRCSYVRLNRSTKKVYFVLPRFKQLFTLEWNEIRPMVTYVPIIGYAGYTSRHPLCLVGVDWTLAPPEEAWITCGNLGWRDDGESARQLWSYMQHFMNHGPEGLPAPPPLPPRVSRKDTFLYGYRQWTKKLREDFSTPKGKRWAVLWAPAKVLWLIAIVFPDSIGAYLDYTVPEVRFPEEVDAICGFESSSNDA